MASACTILCPTTAYSNVLDAIRISWPGEVSIDGKADTWTRVTLIYLGKCLTLSSLVQEQPGDKFSKLILSMHNFFCTVETAAASNQSNVLAHIANAKMLIGIVAEPDFVEDDDRLDSLWTIAESVNGLIFNGDSMLDLRGQRILSRNGDYDVVV